MVQRRRQRLFTACGPGRTDGAGHWGPCSISIGQSRKSCVSRSEAVWEPGARDRGLAVLIVELSRGRKTKAGQAERGRVKGGREMRLDERVTQHRPVGPAERLISSAASPAGAMSNRRPRGRSALPSHGAGWQPSVLYRHGPKDVPWDCRPRGMGPAPDGESIPEQVCDLKKPVVHPAQGI